MKKNFKILLVIFIFLLISLNHVSAQDTEPESRDRSSSINYESAVIDDRCVREKIADPDGAYAKSCQIEQNTEKYIICLNKAFPESRGFFGFFDLFRSRIRITAETLPSLIRTVMMLAFGVVGVSALWITIWGYNKWLIALNSSAEEAAKLWKVFTNGMWGLFFSLGAIFFTWAIFWAAGVRRNDFFQVGEEIAGFLSFPCEDLGDNTDVCNKYNYSCKVGGEFIGGIDTVDVQCTTKNLEEKLQEVRDMPAPITIEPGTELTYEPDNNPCSRFK